MGRVPSVYPSNHARMQPKLRLADTSISPAGPMLLSTRTGRPGRGLNGGPPERRRGAALPRPTGQNREAAQWLSLLTPRAHGPQSPVPRCEPFDPGDRDWCVGSRHQPQPSKPERAPRSTRPSPGKPQRHARKGPASGASGGPQPQVDPYSETESTRAASQVHEAAKGNTDGTDLRTHSRPQFSGTTLIQAHRQYQAHRRVPLDRTRSERAPTQTERRTHP